MLPAGRFSWRNPMVLLRDFVLTSTLPEDTDNAVASSGILIEAVKPTH